MSELGHRPTGVSTRKILSNYILPSTKEVKAHGLVTNTPYPTRSPYGAEEAASTVIHVPKEEIDHFLDTVVKRYIKTIKKETLSFFTRSTNFIATSDSELEYFLTHSLFSRFLNPTLDPDDFDIFFKFIEGGHNYYKIDLAHLDTMEPLEGFHYCSTKTLLRKEGDTAKLLAIKIKDLTLTPDDPDWERAKLFVMSGLCMSLLIQEHPKRHFPMDAINGLVKTLIPQKHIIHRLLAPHMYMQLPLNFAVLYVKKSVALNDQNEPYTCLPCTKNGFVASLKSSYSGLEGNSSYRRFKYRLGPEPIPFEFGKFLAKYWNAVHDFVKEFITDIPFEDETTTLWANDVAHFVPGFPDGKEIWKDDNLSRALATYIYTVTFSHAADHYNYSQTNINQLPSRIRVRPPSSDYRNVPLKKGKIFNRGDLHRHHLAMEMYFKPTNLITILDAKYTTFNAKEALAVEKFKDNLTQIEENLDTLNYLPLNQVATSIQY